MALVGVSRWSLKLTFRFQPAHFDSRGRLFYRLLDQAVHAERLPFSTRRWDCGSLHLVGGALRPIPRTYVRLVGRQANTRRSAQRFESHRDENCDVNFVSCRPHRPQLSSWSHVTGGRRPLPLSRRCLLEPIGATESSSWMGMHLALWPPPLTDSPLAVGSASYGKIASLPPTRPAISVPKAPKLSGSHSSRTMSS
jgi:hypothetical protein